MAITALLDITSDLQRRQWMREGLLQAKTKSFWSSMTGKTKSAIVFQANNAAAGAGHTVVFDYSGNLVTQAIRGKETAAGKGTEKLKFSDKLIVERYRFVVNNGDKFDGKAIGDLRITQHSDSREKLSDQFMRWKDQMIFDTAQGTLNTDTSGVQPPTHIIDTGSEFTFNTLIDIERNLRTSTGFETGGMRRPLEPYITKDGVGCWMIIIDPYMSTKLRQDKDGFQTIMGVSDVRGNDNRNIRGVLGRINKLLIVESDLFFGKTSGTTPGWGLDTSGVELAGLRQYDGTNSSTASWTGQEGFAHNSGELHSRSLIIGAGAIQLGMGKMPEYHFKSSPDFDISSESALETWISSKKTKLVEETNDYAQAKVTNIDHGVIVLDTKVGV